MSMVKPSIDYLATKVDSKYTLVVLAAKRARELVNKSAVLVDTKSNKPVTVALEEVGADAVSYERIKIGMK